MSERTVRPDPTEGYNTFGDADSLEICEDDAAAMGRSLFKFPEAKATWLTAAQLMIADVVGVGVLSLASAVAALGWALGPAFIVLYFPLNLYTGLLLWQVRARFPGSVTYMDMAYQTSGKRLANFSAFIVYLHIFLVLGDYILVLGLALGLIFYDVYICRPIWIFIACLCVLPFNQLRLLNDIRWLCWVNMATITGAVVVTLGYLIQLGQYESLENGSKLEVIASDLDWLTFSTAMSKLAFAYAGQFLYLEIMSEMRDPSTFPKSFVFAGPYQVGMYLIVGCVGYYYKGSLAQGILIDYIPFNPWMRAGAALLFVHMIITYLVKASVVSRALHLWISPNHVNDRGRRGKLEWLAITSSLMLAAFLIANLIPFFESLTGLIGALLVPTASWNLPVVFYVLSCRTTGKPVPWYQWPPLIFVFIAGVVLTITGTYSNMADIAEAWASQGSPFACHCQGIWNTCECSAFHTDMNLVCPNTSYPEGF